MEQRKVAFTDFVDLTGSESLALLDNERISQLTGLTAERIYKSTRMRTRYILKQGKTPLDLAREVTARFLAKTGIRIRDIEALGLVHTEYEGKAPGQIARTLAWELGIDPRNIRAFPYGCAGFPKLVEEQAPLIQALSDGKHCLLLNIETPDRMMDAHDSRATPIFASDATATSLRAGPGHELLFSETEDVVPPDAPPHRPIFKILSSSVEDFSGKKSERTIFKMDGDLAYQNGAALIEQAARASLERVLALGHTDKHIVIVPHQPNAKMVKGFQDLTAPKMQEEYAGKVRSVRFINGMEGKGNTISCTIPSVLARICRIEGVTPPSAGDIVLFPAAGICVRDPGGKMSVGRGAMIWNPDAYRSA